jgi:hypothetical protein
MPDPNGRPYLKGPLTLPVAPRTTYRKLQARFPEVCSADDIEALFHPARAIDLYSDVVAKLTEWPTHDHSILSAP